MTERTGRQNPKKITIPQGTACPLYIAHSAKEITCKSFVPDADRIRVSYFVQAEMDTQYRCFCCGNYQCCEVYRSYQHFQWQDD